MPAIIVQLTDPRPILPRATLRLTKTQREARDLYPGVSVYVTIPGNEDDDSAPPTVLYRAMIGKARETDVDRQNNESVFILAQAHGGDTIAEVPADTIAVAASVVEDESEDAEDEDAEGDAE